MQSLRVRRSCFLRLRWRGVLARPRADQRSAICEAMGRARAGVLVCVCEARVFSRGVLDLCVRFHGSTVHCRHTMQR